MKNKLTIASLQKLIKNQKVIKISFLIIAIIAGIIGVRQFAFHKTAPSAQEDAAVRILLQELDKPSVLSVKLAKLPSTIVLERSRIRDEDESIIRSGQKPQKMVKASFDDAARIRTSPKKRAPKLPLSKKIYRVPGQNYNEAIFFLGDKKIAQQKIQDGKIIEQVGDIPDGKVTFVYEANQSYGEEFYVNGVIDGLSQTFYADGQVKSEAKYDSGELASIKNYYSDGALRSEIDYRDARDFPDDRETGIGKIYYRSGQLKYEWNITVGRSPGYKKTYNRQGKLKVEEYFDSQGKRIEKR